MKNKKILLTITLLFIVCISCVFTAFAHSGRTDANGGHWNRSTGTYHYHTGENAGKSTSTASDNKKNYVEGYDKGHKDGYEEGYKDGNNDGEQSTTKKLWFFIPLIGVTILYWCYKALWSKRR